MNLIAYRVRHITPIQHDWLRSLNDVVEKYFVYVQISDLYFIARNKKFCMCIVYVYRYITCRDS